MEPKIVGQLPMVILSAFIVLASFTISMFVLYKFPNAEALIGAIVTGWIGTGLGSVVGFWFGSSVGGRVKTDPLKDVSSVLVETSKTKEPTDEA